MRFIRLVKTILSFNLIVFGYQNLSRSILVTGIYVKYSAQYDSYSQEENMGLDEKAIVFQRTILTSTKSAENRTGCVYHYVYDDVNASN